MNNLELIAAVLVALVLFLFLAGRGRLLAGRENYGPPPGMARAVAPCELGSRGWADAAFCNPDRAGTSASAMLGYARLSAN
jgi:hypothetical protein